MNEIPKTRDLGREDEQSSVNCTGRASRASKEVVSFAQCGFAQRHGKGNESKESPESPG